MDATKTTNPGADMEINIPLTGQTITHRNINYVVTKVLGADFGGGRPNYNLAEGFAKRPRGRKTYFWCLKNNGQMDVVGWY